MRPLRRLTTASALSASSFHDSRSRPAEVAETRALNWPIDEPSRLTRCSIAERARGRGGLGRGTEQIADGVPVLPREQQPQSHLGWLEVGTDAVVATVLPARGRAAVVEAAAAAEALAAGAPVETSVAADQLRDRDRCDRRHECSPSVLHAAHPRPTMSHEPCPRIA
jgi:hypothetical protein